MNNNYAKYQRLGPTPGPEVQQIFKIQTVRKPDILLPGRWTFNTLKLHKKKLQNFFQNFVFKFFFSRFFLFTYLVLQLLTHIMCQGPYPMRINNLNLFFLNMNPDAVRSGRTCLAKLGVQSGNPYPQSGRTLGQPLSGTTNTIQN